MPALDVVAPVLLGGDPTRRTHARRLVHRRPPGRRVRRARRLDPSGQRAGSAGEALGVVEAALQLDLELLGEHLVAAARRARPSSTGGTIGSPTTPRRGASAGSILPFGRICSLPPIPTGHDRHAELHREVGGARRTASATSGPCRRVPSGKIATGSPGASTASSARIAPRSAVPARPGPHPSAVEEPAAERLTRTARPWPGTGPCAS